MKFKNLENGAVYDVVNEALIPQYEANARFEKVVEPKKEEKAEKKSAKK